VNETTPLTASLESAPAGRDLPHLAYPAIIGKMFAKASKSPWLAAGIVSVITLAVFWPVLSADFVMWDDDLFIYENPTIGGLTIDHLRQILTNVTVSSTWYTPLTGLRWCITYQFCQLNPLGYHLGNLLLHVADAVLVFYVLRTLLILGLSRLGSERPGRIIVCASLGALLWSLHPMQIEAVCWAVNAYDQAMLFLLISLLCYLAASQTNATGRRRLLLMSSLILFVASLLTQPVGVGFVAVLIVLDVYPLGRLGGDNGWWRSATARKALLEKTLFIGAAVAVVLINIVVLARSPVGGHSLVSLAEFGLLDRFMQAMYIWAYYIWRPFWPVNLSPLYTRLIEFDPLSLPFIASAVAVVSGTGILILLRRRWPLGLALGVCYLVLLMPVLGIFEHPYYTSDRYFIVVSVPFSVLVAALLASPLVATRLRNAAFVISVVVIAGLGTLTFRQTHVWHDSVTLFEHMIRTLGDGPYVAHPHCRLGIFFVKQGRPDEAIPHFNQAIEIKPDYAEAYYNRGVAYGKLGRGTEAIADFRRSIEINQDYAEAYTNLGIVYSRLGRSAEAMDAYTQAVKIKPDLVIACNNLAWLIATTGQIKNRDTNEAIRLASHAVELSNYSNPTFSGTLAAAYASAGRFTEAIDTANKAMNLADATSQPQVRDVIRHHLSFYTLGKPYIEPDQKPLPDLNKP
jgi:protein O-mannosyl-transferase